MILLPKQLHTLASVADTKALDLDSEEFSQICERSLTWRGKDFQSRTWLQRWKRETWMQHLCSRTLRPSHTESFVDSWTSYLAASRANPSALLESVRECKTHDTSSHTSETESESADLELFSSKMLKELSQARQQTASQFSSMSYESWKDWVTEQRREYSQRLKSAHLTKESESSSSVWPTATVRDTKGLSARGYQGKPENLSDIVLTEKNWPTPAARDVKGVSGKGRQERKGHPTDTLPNAVEAWPTPTTAEGSKIGSQPNYGQKGLSNHPSIVGLPDREKLKKSGKNQESPIIPPPKSRGKLNENWVEHLMGLPVGWTDLGFWATE